MRSGVLYRSSYTCRGDSLTRVQYRSHISFSFYMAARSASGGTRVRESSNEVSQPEWLDGSYIVPRLELSDEMDRRY